MLWSGLVGHRGVARNGIRRRVAHTRAPIWTDVCGIVRGMTRRGPVPDRERRSEAQQATLTLRLAEAELERLRVAAAEQETSMTALFRERLADILTPSR